MCIDEADPTVVTWTELAVARQKDPCKLDGPHRGVDGALCRSPEASVEVKRTPLLRPGRRSLALTASIRSSSLQKGKGRTVCRVVFKDLIGQ